MKGPRVSTIRSSALRDDDVAWTEERAIALMHAGVPLVEAIQQASWEGAQRIIARDVKAISAYQELRDRQHRERLAEQAERFAKDRAALEAKATLGQKPTLKASLGDILRQKTMKIAR